MLGPAPGAPFRQYETPFFVPLLFASIDRESPAAVDTFPLQAFEGRVDPRSSAQVLLVFEQPAFLWRQEDFERGSEEEALIKLELRIDLKMGNLSAAGVKALHGPTGTLAAVAYPPSVGELIIEREDFPGVRYTAHLPCVLGQIVKVMKGGQDNGQVEIRRVRIIARYRSAKRDLSDLGQ